MSPGMNRGRKPPADIGVMLSVGKPKPKMSAGPPPMDEPDPMGADAGAGMDAGSAELTCPNCGEKCMVTLTPSGGGEDQSSADAGGGADYGDESAA